MCEPESGGSEGLTTVDTTLSVPISHNADTCAVTIIWVQRQGKPSPYLMVK